MSGRGISRRMLLAGVGATGLVAERMIGPFAMPDEEFARFAEDFVAARPVPEGVRALLLGAGERVGAIGFLGSSDSATAAKVRSFERTLLADFTLATGITGPPGDTPLSYAGLWGSSGCGNPYARFDP